MTMDLTKITVPFGLLDDKTQEELVKHGGPYQSYGYRGWFDSYPDWSIKAFTYRVKPKETPRQWWIVDYGGVYPTAFVRKEDAEDFASVGRFGNNEPKIICVVPKG